MKTPKCIEPRLDADGVMREIDDAMQEETASLRYRAMMES